MKLKEPNWQLIWGQVYMENETRKDIMRWVAGRLAVLEELLDNPHNKATCAELRHALTDSPKLKEFQK